MVSHYDMVDSKICAIDATWSGVGTVKTLLGFLVIIACVYAGFQIVPPELTNYSFQDDLKTVAMMGGSNAHATDQELIDAVIKKAQEHEIAGSGERNGAEDRIAGSARGVFGGGL